MDDAGERPKIWENLRLHTTLRGRSDPRAAGAPAVANAVAGNLPSQQQLRVSPTGPVHKFKQRFFNCADI